MKIIYDQKNCPASCRNSVIALGNFDGVHKGHQAVINETIQLASKLDALSSVLTFEPHPYSVLGKDDAGFFRITSADLKARYIKSLGVDILFQVAFDTTFSRITAEDFITDILLKQLQVQHVVIGYDFIFGHKRRGDGSLLEKFCQSHHIGFSRIPAFVNGKEVFSSTNVRSLLRSGKIKDAAVLLGRNYLITGTVEKGDGIGKRIGFPTINIDMNGFLRPKHGVYAVYVHIDDLIFKGVANIGIRPTVSKTQDERLEVHIFDYNSSIYGKHVDIEFVDFLRNEEQFESVEALTERIMLDCADAKLML